MTDRIGNSGSLAHEAIRAAMERQARAAQQIREQAAGIAGQVPGGAAEAGEARRSAFSDALSEGIRDVRDAVGAAEVLPQDVVVGEVQDFHEIAARVKSADLTFKFALEVRNKLIDAYREVMRMNV